MKNVFQKNLKKNSLNFIKKFDLKRYMYMQSKIFAIETFASLLNTTSIIRLE